MGTSEDLIDRREAGRILRVSPATVAKMGREGLLKTRMVKGRYRYLRLDVEAVSRMVNAPPDLASVRNLALRAIIRAEEAERKVGELAELFGLTSYRIAVEAKDVRAFHEEAQKRLLRDPPVRAPEARALARRLLAITEEYLKLVTDVTGEEEPWRVYLELSQHLIENTPRRHCAIDPDLLVAYGYLEAARRHLRPLAYFWVRRTHGRTVAQNAFLGEHVTDDIIAVLYPS